MDVGLTTKAYFSTIYRLGMALAYGEGVRLNVRLNRRLTMKRIIGILAIAIAMLSFSGQTFASTGFSFGLGTDNFYASVGNYDYYPYTLPSYGNGYRPRINFYDTLGDYGSWVSLSPYGQCWRPYVTSGWRPYTYGHWIYTSYGPTWSGYEPWAWIGYHYGNWVWSERFGWVWIPGYDYSPGRVIWSYGYDSIGWMPAPPVGYDYGYYNGAPYYGSGYYEPYYRSSNINFNLWVFINTNHFGYPNYSNYYLGRDSVRRLFDDRRVRIQKEPIQRSELERIVKQRINVVPVQEREIETSRRTVKAVVPIGEEVNIRKNAKPVVEKVIAPAFKQNRKSFKGEEAENRPSVDKFFRQEDRRPENRGRKDSDEVVRRGEPSRDQEFKPERNTEKERGFERNRPENNGRSFESERDRDRQFETKPKGYERKEERNVPVQRNRDSEFESRSRSEKERSLKHEDQKPKYESRPSQDRSRDFESRDRSNQRENERRMEEQQKIEREQLDRRNNDRFREPERRNAPSVTREDEQRQKEKSHSKDAEEKEKDKDSKKKSDHGKHSS
jgi:hypothetical protein